MRKRVRSMISTAILPEAHQRVETRQFSAIRWGATLAAPLRTIMVLPTMIMPVARSGRLSNKSDCSEAPIGNGGCHGTIRTIMTILRREAFSVYSPELAHLSKIQLRERW
jgi:hypothetical protein